ncbi:hypothetical protein [Neobacillus sp. YIM B06451]|uniref:hypothetical protein n=1 Tax=Neobacillus sp. YIM B06451 TaxID=3070994 RepID=UPI00292D5F27|nr:hypothetical protein [Neobacillus sp. YIM B06451]
MAANHLMEYNVREGCLYLAVIWFFIILILGISGFALIIDLKRKKNNYNFHIPTNPNTKPGDSSNYIMGDNKDTGGIQ